MGDGVAGGGVSSNGGAAILENESALFLMVWPGDCIGALFW